LPEEENGLRGKGRGLREKMEFSVIPG